VLSGEGTGVAFAVVLCSHQVASAVLQRGMGPLWYPCGTPVGPVWGPASGGATSSPHVSLDDLQTQGSGEQERGGQRDAVVRASKRGMHSMPGACLSQHHGCASIHAASAGTSTDVGCHTNRSQVDKRAVRLAS